MACDIEATDEFGVWYHALSPSEQDDVLAYVELLEVHDVRLGFPHSSGIKGSRHAHMRELRVQSGGSPIRIFYAFNPIRNAILLTAGDKTGDNRFYKKMIPIADKLYDVHLEELRKEGLI